MNWILTALLFVPPPPLSRVQGPPDSAPPKQTKKQKPEVPDNDDHVSWPRTPEMIEREMRLRARIEFRESKQRKAVEAAAKIMTLAQGLKDSHGTRSVLTTLKTIGKLAKQIRKFGGGGKSEKVRQDWPSSIVAGADQIISLAKTLKEELETLDRRVISVTIIGWSNAIIQLSDYLKERVSSDEG